MRTPKRRGDKPNHKRRQPWIAPLARPRFDSKPALSPATQTKQVARIEIPPAVEHEVDPPVDPALSTAATQVFSIVELTEHVLNSDVLAVRDLLLLQRVNQCFLGAITRDPSLRSKMHLQASAAATPKATAADESTSEDEHNEEVSYVFVNSFIALKSERLSLFTWLEPLFRPKQSEASDPHPALAQP
nr:hypothetical protein B0A51_05853 [Rachicladosporium sp. CCFEE 5018]